MAHNAAPQRSIRHRFPSIDPLHHLLVELVRRYRAGNDDERIKRGTHISINEIAAGLRNTGCVFSMPHLAALRLRAYSKQ